MFKKITSGFSTLTIVGILFSAKQPGAANPGFRNLEPDRVSAGREVTIRSLCKDCVYATEHYGWPTDIWLYRGIDTLYSTDFEWRSPEGGWDTLLANFAIPADVALGTWEMGITGSYLNEIPFYDRGKLKIQPPPRLVKVYPDSVLLPKPSVQIRLEFSASHFLNATEAQVWIQVGALKVHPTTISGTDSVVYANFDFTSVPAGTYAVHAQSELDGALTGKSLTLVPQPEAALTPLTIKQGRKGQTHIEAKGINFTEDSILQMWTTCECQDPPHGLSSGRPKIVDWQTENDSTLLVSITVASNSIATPRKVFIRIETAAFGEVVELEIGTFEITENLPPIFEPSDSVFSVSVDEKIITTVQASDPEPDDTVRYFLVSGPEKAQLDSLSGLFEWTPAEVDSGRHEIRIEARDMHAGMSGKNLIVDVAALMRPEIVSPNPGSQIGPEDFLIWVGSDPDSSDAFRLEIATDSLFSEVLVSFDSLSGNSMQIAEIGVYGTLPLFQRLYWRVSESIPGNHPIPSRHSFFVLVRSVSIRNSSLDNTDARGIVLPERIINLLDDTGHLEFRIVNESGQQFAHGFGKVVGGRFQLTKNVPVGRGILVFPEYDIGVPVHFR